MDVLELFTTAFGVIGFIGGAVGYFGQGRANAIIKGQAQLLDVRDREIADKDKQLAGLTAERDSLLQSNANLKDLAQGSPQLSAFTKEMRQLIKVVKSLHRDKA